MSAADWSWPYDDDGCPRETQVDGDVAWEPEEPPAELAPEPVEEQVEPAPRTPSLTSSLRQLRISGGDLTLTSDQEQGAALACRAVQYGGSAIIRGYAGTGKSVLLGRIVKALFDRGIPFQVCTPTGRAAARLRALGVDASTVHRWRYVPISNKSGELLGFRPKDDLDLPAGMVLLLDEASMLAPEIYLDLVNLVQPGAETGRAMIVIGDGFQLPPVLDEAELRKYGADFSVLDRRWAKTFDQHAEVVELRQVLRQTADNPVLHLATALRDPSMAPPRPDGNRLLILRRKRDYAEQVIERAGSDTVVLTWTNADRAALNVAARRARGRTGAAQTGDRALVLANNADHLLCNGDLVDLLDVQPGELTGEHASAARALLGTTPHLRVQFRDALGYEGEADALFYDHKAEKKAELSIFAKARRLNKEFGLPLPLIIDYGYCLTVHKSQGSEWPNVLIYAPDRLLDYMPDDHTLRWLYTAITRASERVTFAGGSKLAYILGG